MPICVRCSGFNPLSTGAESRTLKFPENTIIFMMKFQSPQHRGGVAHDAGAIECTTTSGPRFNPLSTGAESRTGPKQRTDGPDELLFQSPQHRGGVAHGAGVGPVLAHRFSGFNPLSTGAESRTRNWTAGPIDGLVSFNPLSTGAESRTATTLWSGQRSSSWRFNPLSTGAESRTRLDFRLPVCRGLRFNPLSTGAESRTKKSLLVTGVVT